MVSTLGRETKAKRRPGGFNPSGPLLPDRRLMDPIRSGPAAFSGPTVRLLRSPLCLRRDCVARGGIPSFCPQAPKYVATKWLKRRRLAVGLRVVLQRANYCLRLQQAGPGSWRQRGGEFLGTPAPCVPSPQWRTRAAGPVIALARAQPRRFRRGLPVFRVSLSPLKRAPSSHRSARHPRNDSAFHHDLSASEFNLGCPDCLI